MQKIFTPEFMLANCGCYSEEQLMKCSFMKNSEVTLMSILDSEIPLKDKFWFVRNKIATPKEDQLIAIGNILQVG